MYRLKKILIVAILSIPMLLFAQDNEKESIITDRPDQTESAFLVPKGNFQIETGFQFINQRNQVYSFQVANTLFRYGLFNFIELRLNAGYLFEKYEGVWFWPMEDINGFEPVFVGVKIPLVKENGIIPQIAFMGHLTLPIGSEELNPDKILPDFRLNFENTLSERFSLGYNMGIEWGELRHSYLYTVALGAAITDKFGAFIEPFGYFHSSNLRILSEDEHYCNGGLSYLVKNNIQLDAFAGAALTHKEYFAGLGFSIRIPD